MQFYHTTLGRKILEKEVELVTSGLQGCTQVLSIGCGPALVEAEVRRRHPAIKVVGIDISPEMVKQAPSDIPVSQGDGQHLDFEERTFDGALFLTSLEFIPDYEQAIREAYRVLRNGGKIVVLMLNPDSVYFKERWEGTNSYIRKYIQHTDIQEIQRILKRYFEIRREGYRLGIVEGVITDSTDPRVASLYMMEGKKRLS